MKKLMNLADAFVDERLEGPCAADPGLRFDTDDRRVVRHGGPARRGWGNRGTFVRRTCEKFSSCRQGD